MNKQTPAKVQRSKHTLSFMKKLFFAFALAAILLPWAPPARSQDVSVDFFYTNLNGGSWIEVGDYGYCWQPDAAASDPSWRPYADGYWAYTDLGWTWVSYEDFGWATYHYGRWVRLTDYGWVWRPGYEWGPAWVSWRFGGGYAGWAPLPPETEVVYESRPLTGHLDVEFDIGPACYNFVDVRYIGEPVLRSRIVPYERNITYVTQTVNITNITYKNKTVYSYGPDLNTVNQYSTRPVQTLKLERQTNVDAATAAKSGSLTKVQGNSLVVAAPAEIKRSAAPLPPPKVKTKVEQPKIEKGWSGVGDENAKQQLKQKFKAEDSKKIPPPAPGGNAAAAAGASASVSPGLSASPATAMSPLERGKGKGKGRGAEQFQAGAGASASPTVVGAIASPSASVGLPERGKGKGKRFEQAQPGAARSSMVSPSAAPSATAAPEFGKPGKGKRGEKFGGTPPPLGPVASPEGIASPLGAPEYGKPGKGRRAEQLGATAPTPAATAGTEEFNKPGKRKGFERQNLGPTPGGAASLGENPTEPRGGKHKGFDQPGTTPGSATGLNEGPRGGKPNKRPEQPTAAPAQEGGPAGGQGNPYGEDPGKRKAGGLNAPLNGGQPPAGQPVEKKQGKGKEQGRGQGQTPTPPPQ